jgi:hypothetical protein
VIRVRPGAPVRAVPADPAASAPALQAAAGNGAPRP